MDKIDMILRLILWRVVERISPDGKVFPRPWGVYMTSFERLRRELGGKSITAIVLLGRKPKALMVFNVTRPPEILKERIAKGLEYGDREELFKSLVIEGLNIASGLFASRLSKVAGEDLLPSTPRVLKRPEEIRTFLCYIGQCGEEFPVFSARIADENGGYVRMYLSLSEELVEKLMAVDNDRVLRGYTERPLHRRWILNGG